MAIRERNVDREEDREGARRKSRDETLPAPWQAEDYGAGEEDEPRQRHDAFTLARRRVFLKALAKTGCMLDACRAVGVSRSTVYNLQDSDEEFCRHCRLALEMANVPVELAAWERGVTGIEEEVIRGGKVVGTRLKRSDSILRLLLQGSDPKKYGPRPGFTRKRLLKWERKQIERELRARMAANAPPIEQVREEILRRLDNMRRHQEPAKLAAGWTKARDGDLIPPGWTWSGDTGDEAIDQHGPSGDS
jgi:hypothetical protein